MVNELVPSILDRELQFENIEGIVVLESEKKQYASVMDIEKEAEADGWVTRISGDKQAGIYSYQPPMAKLIRAFKESVLSLAESLGYKEMIFPRHYRREALNAFGWIDNDKLKFELMRINPLCDSDGRSNYDLFGDPVQCLGFYETLRIIQEKNNGFLPEYLFENDTMRVYEDQGGWTVRNELKSRLKGGFATGFEFAGAELVWAGKKDDCYSTRWNTLNSVIDFVSELDLEYRIVIGGSCSRDKKQPELKGKSMRLYDMPTMDIELKIPYLEKIGSDCWIEIGGGDIAGTRLTNNFGLKMEDGSELYSGCQGVGWQRIVYGFLSQKGLDYSNWPKIIKDKLKEDYFVISK